jgi:hypothetical protein
MVQSNISVRKMDWMAGCRYKARCRNWSGFRDVLNRNRRRPSDFRRPREGFSTSQAQEMQSAVGISAQPRARCRNGDPEFRGMYLPEKGQPGMTQEFSPIEKPEGLDCARCGLLPRLGVRTSLTYSPISVWRRAGRLRWRRGQFRCSRWCRCAHRQRTTCWR